MILRSLSSFNGFHTRLPTRRAAVKFVARMQATTTSQLGRLADTYKLSQLLSRFELIHKKLQHRGELNTQYAKAIMYLINVALRNGVPRTVTHATADSFMRVLSFAEEASKTYANAALASNDADDVGSAIQQVKSKAFGVTSKVQQVKCMLQEMDSMLTFDSYFSTTAAAGIVVDKYDDAADAPSDTGKRRRVMQQEQQQVEQVTDHVQQVLVAQNNVLIAQQDLLIALRVDDDDEAVDDAKKTLEACKTALRMASEEAA